MKLAKISILIIPSIYCCYNVYNGHNIDYISKRYLKIES